MPTKKSRSAKSGRLSAAFLEEELARLGYSKTRLAELVGMPSETLRSYKPERRSLANARLKTIAQLDAIAGFSPDALYALLKAVEADEILEGLLAGDGDIRLILQQPLRQEVVHRLVFALKSDGILDSDERLTLMRRLWTATETTGADEEAAATVRNQACYLLARIGGRGAQENLLTAFSHERHPIVRRSMAVGQALLGNQDFLRRAYVDRSRWDDLEQRRNLAYMSWYSGERKGPKQSAYSETSDWTGEITFRWLVTDILKEPSLVELNIHSLDALLTHKGSHLLTSDTATTKVLASALADAKGFLQSDTLKRSKLFDELSRVERQVVRAIG
jgi:hypothetical protein